MWDEKDQRYRLRNERETENQIQKKRRKIKSEKEEEKDIVMKNDTNNFSHLIEYIYFIVSALIHICVSVNHIFPLRARAI